VPGGRRRVGRGKNRGVGGAPKPGACRSPAGGCGRGKGVGPTGGVAGAGRSGPPHARREPARNGVEAAARRVPGMPERGARAVRDWRPPDARRADPRSPAGRVAVGGDVVARRGGVRTGGRAAGGSGRACPERDRGSGAGGPRPAVGARSERRYRPRGPCRGMGPVGVLDGAQALRRRGPATSGAGGPRASAGPEAPHQPVLLAPVGRVADGLGEVLERGEVVAGAEAVDMGQDGADPAARGAKPSQRRSGLSQTRRRQERCRRSISAARRSGSSRSSPSVIEEDDRALRQDAAAPVAVEGLQAGADPGAALPVAGLCARGGERGVDVALGAGGG
jgi:hypothetical protein